MKRLSMALGLFLMCVSPSVMAQSSARAPVLRAQTSVSGDVVRIGDILENSGAAASVAVFRAPALGATGTIQTDRMLEAIRANGLLIVDTQGLDQIVVTRTSRLWELEDIQKKIISAIAEKHALDPSSPMMVTFDPEVRPVHLESTLTAEPRTERVVWNNRNGRFDVMFTLPQSAAATAHGLRFTGTLVEAQDVAILTRTLAKGDVLRAEDVSIERRTRTEVDADAMSASQPIIGQAARRALRAGQPLRNADLMRPEVVAKGETVTLVVQTAGILLTTRGQAQQNGAVGDEITILNPLSKRTLQGKVTGPGKVEVMTVRPVASLQKQ